MAISKTQALGLAVLLMTYELESPVCEPIPPQWETELKQAIEVLRSELEQQAGPAGRYRGEQYAKPRYKNAN